jgi:hypothetical protein
VDSSARGAPMDGYVLQQEGLGLLGVVDLVDGHQANFFYKWLSVL